MFVPCTCSPVVAPVLDGGGEEVESESCWGGGGDERRDTSADAAMVASSLNVKLSFTRSDKLLAKFK